MDFDLDFAAAHVHVPGHLDIGLVEGAVEDAEQGSRNVVEGHGETVEVGP